MSEEIKKEDCGCGKDCECKKDNKQTNITHIEAYPAKDPNNKLIAVFEQEIECKECGKKWTHQLIVGVETIFQFAQIFDQAIRSSVSENKIVTPGGNKTGGGIIIP